MSDAYSEESFESFEDSVSSLPLTPSSFRSSHSVISRRNSQPGTTIDESVSAFYLHADVSEPIDVRLPSSSRSSSSSSMAGSHSVLMHKKHSRIHAQKAVVVCDRSAVVDLDRLSAAVGTIALDSSSLSAFLEDNHQVDERILDVVCLLASLHMRSEFLPSSASFDSLLPGISSACQTSVARPVPIVREQVSKEDLLNAIQSSSGSVLHILEAAIFSLQSVLQRCYVQMKSDLAIDHFCVCFVPFVLFDRCRMFFVSSVGQYIAAEVEELLIMILDCILSAVPGRPYSWTLFRSEGLEEYVDVYDILFQVLGTVKGCEMKALEGSQVILSKLRAADFGAIFQSSAHHVAVDVPSVPTAAPELHDSHCDHLSANVAPLVEEKPVCDLGLLLPLLDALHIRFPTITHSEIRRVLERTVASVLADPLVADVLVRHSSAHLQSNMDMP